MAGSKWSFNMTSGGRGRGRGASVRGTGATAGPSRGRGRGRGRGGRGRGASFSNSFGASSNDFGSFAEDEEDAICGQAAGQAELEASFVCQAFVEANAAEDLPGFDKTAGQIWIYPTNRPVRDYQFDIVKTALFNNTLVSLPTGLGKTFIAAVVMYNFNRWYPQDLVVFMAPTRPLVTQQLEACHQIVGISPSRTIEMTGQIAPKKREELWKTKSVFFLTPQVMTSDLAKGVCPAERVRCVVVDEAHKALGQHAYAQVISMLVKKNPLFRVLALSATPGSDLAAVQQVFRNLLISKVELRTEASSDLLPYQHNRTVDKIVVPLDDYIQSVHSRMLDVFQLYTGKLMKQNAIQGRDGSCLSRFQLLKARESFRQTIASRIPQYQKGYIECDFNVCISLAHSLELLTCHGLRTYYNFLQGVFNKEKGNAAVASELNRNTNIQSILTEVKEKMGIVHDNSTTFNSSSLFSTNFPNPNSSCSSVEEDQTDYLISHPKMRALKDIILKHFTHYQTRNDTTRVMIFSQYRDSVQEIGKMLATLGKLVKPMVFIGQASTGGGGKGLKQKDQVQVVQRFRNGGFNVLVSTCVGEEGLDIGEVDLIICFDASKSPTRLVQRMGRTGRKREGRIVFLLTKGKEERNYSAGFSLQNSISKNITDPSKLQPFLYKFSPRMVPNGVDPECFKMSVILTCEQEHRREEDDVIVIDDDDNVGDFLKPAVKSKGKPKKQTTKSGTKTKKGADRAAKPSSGSSASSQSASNSRTLTQCFEALIEKSKKAQAQATKSSDYHEVILDKEDVQDENHQLSFEVYDGFDGINGEDVEESRLLREIFDDVDPSDVVTKPCINFPKLPYTPLVWPTKSNDEYDKSLLLTDSQLERVRKRLETFMLVSPFKEKCECGNTANESSLQAALSQRNGTETCDLQKDSSVNEQSGAFQMDTPFNMDEGFIFEDNDVFFEDDWDGETDNVCPNPSKMEDSSTTSNDEFGSPVRSNRGISQVKPVSVHEDDDSSTSFEDNLSPIVVKHDDVNSHLKLANSYKESQMRSKSQVDRNLFKDDLLLFESDDDYLENSPEPNNIEKSANLYPRHSSPRKDGIQSPTNSLSDLSPDLSQFRLENRIKRVQQGDTDLLVACSQMFDPDDPNGKKIVTVIDDDTWLSPVKGAGEVPQSFNKSPFIENPAEDDECSFIGASKSGVSKKKFTFNKSPVIANLAEDSECTYIGAKSSGVCKKKFSFKKKPSPIFDSTLSISPPPNPSSTSTASSKKQALNCDSTFSTSVFSTPIRPSTGSRNPVPIFDSTFSTPFTPIRPSTSNKKPAATFDSTFSSPFNRRRNPVPIFDSTFSTSSTPIRPSTGSRKPVPISGSPLSTFSTSIRQSTSTQVRQKPRRKRRKLNTNPFLDVEADAEDDSSSMDEDDEFGGLDDFDDSFVVPEDDDDTVTDSQQVRYIRSVRDIEAVPFRRPAMPPPSFNDSIVEEEFDADFANDSFCADNDDEVEFADIGVFTQAMNVAKENLLNENPGSAKRRQTRRHVRQKQANMGVQHASETVPKKIRKRVIRFDSSDED